MLVTGESMPHPAFPSDFQLTNIDSDVDGTPARVWTNTEGSSRIAFQEVLMANADPTAPPNTAVTGVPLLLEEAWLDPQTNSWTPTMSYTFSGLSLQFQPFVRQ